MATSQEITDREAAWDTRIAAWFANREKQAEEAWEAWDAAYLTQK